MGDLALPPFFIFLSHHDSNRVPKTTQIDESQIESKESSPGDQKENDERQFKLADRDRYKNNIGRKFGNGAKCLVDRLVDTQDSLQISSSEHSSSD